MSGQATMHTPQPPPTALPEFLRGLLRCCDRCRPRVAGTLVVQLDLLQYGGRSVKTDPKEKAFEKYCEGKNLRQIAREMGVHPSTVTRWKNAGHWDKKKPARARKEPESSRRPKLVSFEGARASRQTQNDPFDVGDLNTIEGQTALIDKLLGFAMNQVQKPASPQQYSSAMNAVPKLMAERRAIAPLNRTALLLLLMDKYRDPADLLADLKVQGWGRKAS